jgi:hypothetical protein
MYMSIKIFRQLQHEPRRMMFKELKGKEEAGPITTFLKKKKTHTHRKPKTLKHCFFRGGERTNIRELSLFPVGGGEAWTLIPKKKK